VNNLSIILEKLKSLKDTFNGTYFVPDVWNSFGFESFGTDESRSGEIKVNPYEFIASCIETYIFKNVNNEQDYLCSNDEKNTNPINLNKSVVYSMLPRMFTAWNHDYDGKLVPGTFLKAICLLPYLKKLDVDIIYLLPIFEYSDKHKKSEIGSPYAIKNIYKLDYNLHDELLGNYSEELINIEFKAFVEACHILGIKVMVDFVFRSCARDNDIMITHPDWFYWIYKRFDNYFSAPTISGTSEPFLVNDSSVKELYKQNETKEYIHKFTYDPKTLDPFKWEYIVGRHYDTGENIIDLIEEAYDITTVPGFSDVINDSQPPWSDVTFYRFYFDVNQTILDNIGGTVYPPFMLQDAIKSSLYPGKVPNVELWDYVSNVIPYYQTNFGIDGARIDMGHALPSDINLSIVRKAKDINPNFIFWSEEFHAEKSGQAKSEGFHFISGLLWSIYPKLHEQTFNNELLETLMISELPVAAAVETADTPRASLVHGNNEKLEMLVLLNSFIPNSVSFINNGFDMCERQPMNLGLGNTNEGKYVLNHDDPMFGKLAFFDNYKLHWLNHSRNWILNLLYKVSDIRKKIF